MQDLGFKDKNLIIPFVLKIRAANFFLLYQSNVVYIEFWGYDNDSKYLARKEEKQAIYKKYNFNLIELTDDEVLNLDDILPRLLLKFVVQAY
ncbi:hypothetical protein GO003_007360 [Methylicorpusculum oleiharenae]|uniref:hypothetical protein n=1 Tax=Methylicorpusculum oleiharenae TaxID=1338687 RepID=UPI001E3ED91B|nr:hypothetical protein [Methylicorpusculum oleiharenae]MCD2450202.1 hypothetical protein [Methylicorpusculum oleiharenae]